MRNFYDFDMVPLGTEGLDISAFDCNCDEVNSFFHDEATDYLSCWSFIKAMVSKCSFRLLNRKWNTEIGLLKLMET